MRNETKGERARIAREPQQRKRKQTGKQPADTRK